MPRDTQAAVDPPQPSLLAVGPGCPSLKPATAQLMGLLPGNVFPTPPPETSFTLSPAQASNMLIQKAVTGRHLLAPTMRAATAPGILLQRGPLPIQPKLPISIQPRLVQISPKPSGQKPAPGLTFMPGTASQNILLSPPVGPKQPTQPQPTPSLPKPVSLQLVNQGGSIVIQPQGLFQGQNQFLLPNQTPVTMAQPVVAPRPLLSPAGIQGSTVQGGVPSVGPLVDSSQILTVPQRQLNFSPVFTTPTGQLALRPGALLSGPLQLQSAAPTVFQMPAQLAGAYASQAQGQRGALVHSPALGNHITLINSAGMLTPDMTSISIVNGPSVVQGRPFTAQAQRPAAGGPEGQLSLPQTSVLLLPERPIPEERGAEVQLHNLSQQNRHLLPHAPLEPPAPEPQSHTPPVVTLLQPLTDATHSLEPIASLPKHLIHQSELPQVAEEGQSPTPQNKAFMQNFQQQALKPLASSSETLAGTMQVGTHASPAANEIAASPALLPVVAQAASPALLPVVAQAQALTVVPEPVEMPSPVHSGPEHSNVLSSPPIGQNSLGTPPSSFSSLPAPGGHSSASSVSVTGSVNPQGQASTGVCGSPSPLPVNVPHQQPALLPMPPGLSVETEPPGLQQVQQTTLVTTDGKMCTSEIQGPLGPQGPRLYVQEHQVQTAPQPRVQVAAPETMEKEERLTQAMRRHRVQQQLCMDHGAVLNPNSCSPFVSLEDAVRHLLPYHTCTRTLPSQADSVSVDEQFEAVSGLLLKRTTEMLNKYRQLLLGETQQVSPSAEMVMLERLFLQSERLTLGEEKRNARRDPESFLLALRKPSSPHGVASSAPPGTGASGSPPSPPAWALQSDRPPGLKTYRSSSRGALRLTIKHESGSRKVVRNSACDITHTAPAGHKRNHSGRLTNGGDVQREQVLLDPLQSQGPELGHLENSNGAKPVQPAEVALHPDRELPRMTAVLQSKLPPVSLAKPEPPASTEPSLPDPCAPKLKRHKLERSSTGGPDSPPVAEDSALSEHLQSAIDSILELQRLQGHAAAQPRLQQGTALEQAVSSILERQL